MPPRPPVDPIIWHYGPERSQFGQLWIPRQASRPGRRWPVVALIHGGFWRVAYGADLMEPLARDLVDRDVAVWNIEYRRVGEPGGGYPGTLTDVAAAFDALVSLADEHPLDVGDVVSVGHSAGGHLALWLASRARLDDTAPGARPALVPRLAIGQGPAFDLRAVDAAGLSNHAASELLGGSAQDVPDRYDIATPRLDAGVPMVVVRGVDDDIVPARFTTLGGTASGGVETIDVPGDHFALIDPSTAAWRAVLERLGR